MREGGLSAVCFGFMRAVRGEVELSRRTVLRTLLGDVGEFVCKQRAAARESWLEESLAKDNVGAGGVGVGAKGTGGTGSARIVVDADLAKVEAESRFELGAENWAERLARGVEHLLCAGAPEDGAAAGGEQRRIGICRAAHVEAAVLALFAGRGRSPAILAGVLSRFANCARIRLTPTSCPLRSSPEASCDLHP